MEITKREVIASITILAIMSIIGFFISDKIIAYQEDKKAEYMKAVQIDDPELFKYGMETNVGNAFVYGDLEAVDPVSLPEIDGEYLYIDKTEEHYNMHTRVVTKTDANGKSYTETEIYYSWDYHDRWTMHSDKIKFCGTVFDYSKINSGGLYHLDTIKTSHDVRFVYYVKDTKHTGTIYTNLSDNTISDKSNFTPNKNIDETLEMYTPSNSHIPFWILWILLTIVIIVVFYRNENRWLE